MNLIAQLQRHLKFINSSCIAYDFGEVEEALRIAVSLRVLFHDTPNSTSLITHIGKKESIHLISTIGIRKTHQQLGDSLIYYLPGMITSNGLQPNLGKGPPAKNIKCETWWNEIILAQNQRFSRRDVVISSANQDGGAHVDISPNKKTVELKKGVGTLTKFIEGVVITEELADYHFPILRQIGYEVLNSPELINLA